MRSETLRFAQGDIVTFAVLRLFVSPFVDAVEFDFAAVLTVMIDLVDVMDVSW